MKTNTQHFDKLVSKALDLTITKIEANQLSALLDQNPNLQRRYCKTILLESLFHWEENENIDRLEPKIIHFPILNYAFSLAAVFVCLFSAWLLHNFLTQPPPPTEVRIAPSIDQVAEELTANFQQINRNPLSVNPDSRGKILQMAAEYSRGITSKNLDASKFTFGHENGLTMMSSESMLSTPSSSGVLPMVDGEMIKLGSMEIDPVSRTAEIVETLRVYDVKRKPGNYKAVDAVIHINQGFSELSESTEFILSLHALSTLEEDSIIQLDSSEQSLFSDNDQSTWERLDTAISLPDGTDYLVVALSARRSGLGALNSHLNEFFGDELEVSFVGI